MGLSVIFASAALLLLNYELTQVEALLCYDGKYMDEISLVNCSDCRFCGVAGSAPDFLTPLSFSAVGPSELDSQDFIAEKILTTGGNGIYEVNSFCLLESYDFGKMPEISAPENREVLVRCFCAQNRCNQGASLQDFFQQISAGRLK